jgi:hypothetical protein
MLPCVWGGDQEAVEARVDAGSNPEMYDDGGARACCDITEPNLLAT